MAGTWPALFLYWDKYFVTASWGKKEGWRYASGFCSHTLKKLLNNIKVILFGNRVDSIIYCTLKRLLGSLTIL